MSRQGNNSIAHKYQFFPFYPVGPSVNLAEDIYSPERSPYRSLKNQENETTPDLMLIDRNHTSPKSPDGDSWSPLMLEKTQQPSTTPTDSTDNAQMVTPLPGEPKLNTTTSRTSTISQYRTNCRVK